MPHSSVLTTSMRTGLSRTAIIRRHTAFGAMAGRRRAVTGRWGIRAGEGRVRSGASLVEDKHSVNRLTALTDGVFAIALTVLVLQIAVPRLQDAASPAQLRAALARQEGQFVSYVVTFVVIAAFWHQHRRLFRLITGHDEGVARINNLFLLLVAFLPFPSALMGRYSGNSAAIVFFDLAVIAVGAVFSLLWLRLRRSGRLDDRIPRAHWNWVPARTLAASAVLAASAAVAPFDTSAASYLWFGVPPVIFAVNLHYRAAVRRAERH